MLFNGHYTVDMLGAMLVARYTCNAGFNLVGLPFLTCTPDGSWRGMMPLCIPGYGGATPVPPSRATTVKTPPSPTWHIVTLTTKSQPVTTRPPTVPLASGIFTVVSMSPSTPNTVSMAAGITTTVPMGTSVAPWPTRMSKWEPPTTQTSPSQSTIPTVTPRPQILTTTMVTAPHKTVEVPSTTPSATVTSVTSVSTTLGVVIRPTTPQTLPVTLTPMDGPITVVRFPVSSMTRQDDRVLPGKQSSCPPIPLVEFAEATFQGQRVVFRCLPGFVLIGSNVTTCLPSGFWDGFPECLRKDEWQ